MIAIKIALSPLFYIPAYAQETYSSGEFLEKSLESQNAYMQIAVTMAGVVATQVRPEIAHCIDDWYGGETMARRNDHIRSVMRNHPEFHPAGVILAVIQKACGKFSGDL